VDVISEPADKYWGRETGNFGPAEAGHEADVFALRCTVFVVLCVCACVGIRRECSDRGGQR
jgi:hypothetical protein